jgi:hypothetical protein
MLFSVLPKMQKHIYHTTRYHIADDCDDDDDDDDNNNNPP